MGKYGGSCSMENWGRRGKSTKDEQRKNSENLAKKKLGESYTPYYIAFWIRSAQKVFFRPLVLWYYRSFFAWVLFLVRNYDVLYLSKPTWKSPHSACLPLFPVQNVWQLCVLTYTIPYGSIWKLVLRIYFECPLCKKIDDMGIYMIGRKKIYYWRFTRLFCPPALSPYFTISYFRQDRNENQFDTKRTIFIYSYLKQVVVRMLPHPLLHGRLPSIVL